MQELRHTWPLFVSVWEGVSTLQLALPRSSRCHKENQLQGAEPCPAPCFAQVWDATGGQVGMLLHCPPPSSYFRKGIWRKLWLAWLFTLLCSQEPEKNALQAGGNNSRRIQSLHHTIFQTLSVFESYVLFSLRRKEFPSVSAWETTWLPHLRQIFQSGSNQTVTMNRAACYSSHVDLGFPQESAPALGTLVAVAARQLLGKQFFLSCCLFVFPHTDSRPFLGLTSAEWWHTGYSGLLFCFSSFSD